MAKRKKLHRWRPVEGESPWRRCEKCGLKRCGLKRRTGPNMGKPFVWLYDDGVRSWEVPQSGPRGYVPECMGVKRG